MSEQAIGICGKMRYFGASHGHLRHNCSHGAHDMSSQVWYALMRNVLVEVTERTGTHATTVVKGRMNEQSSYGAH